MRAAVGVGLFTNKENPYRDNSYNSYNNYKRVPQVPRASLVPKVSRVPHNFMRLALANTLHLHTSFHEALKLALILNEVKGRANE